MERLFELFHGSADAGTGATTAAARRTQMLDTTRSATDFVTPTPNRWLII